MTPKEIKKLREDLGRTQEQFAALVGATAMTIGRWERGETRPLEIYQEKLDKLKKFVGRTE